MKQSWKTRKPSPSLRGGLLNNQAPVVARADTRDVSNLAGISLPGDRHRLTSVIRGIINVTGRR